MSDDANTESIPDESYLTDFGYSALHLLDAMTLKWQSFSQEADSDDKRGAMIRLVLSGLAKIKTAYKITNSRTGEWVRLRFICSGDCFADPLAKAMDAKCQPGWFVTDDRGQTSPAELIRIATETNEWNLAFTSAGSQLWEAIKEDPSLFRVLTFDPSSASIINDGSESGTENPQNFDSDWTTLTEAADLLGRKPYQVSRMLDKGDLTDNGKEGSSRRINPASILRYATRSGVILNPNADSRDE